MPIFRRTIDMEIRPAEDAQRPLPEIPVEAAWFEEALCRNCGAARRTPHCGQCGQKAAQRLVWRDIGKETWDRVRLFELKSVSTVGKLLTTPGTVAREWVLGRRTAYMHPLTLLVALVAVLVLVLAANRYFQAAGEDHDVGRMADRVMAYANWSFSLGIFAIFTGSWAVFRHRLNTNAIEHAVLAVYCQAVILGLIVVNLLPTLVWRDPGFVMAHKAASQWYVPAIKLAIVGTAYRQFFLLDLRVDWPRLLAACAVFLGANWLLLRAYAAAILWLVTTYP